MLVPHIPTGFERELLPIIFAIQLIAVVASYFVFRK
jgi:hypothetical protein